MRLIKKGATSQTVYIEVLDSTSTTGGRKTGLAFGTSSLTAYYVRIGAAATAITLITQTVSGAWTSGGFVEVDSANMPGVYRLDIPDAAVASGVDSVVVTLKGATGMVQVSLAIQLTAVDLQNATTMGLTNLDAAISSVASAASQTAMQTDVTAIKAKTTNLPASPAATGDAMALTSGERNSVADAILDRNMATGTDSGSPSVRTVRQALRFLRNKWSIAAGTLTVTKEDDSTSSWTAAITTTAGNPVSGADPA